MGCVVLTDSVHELGYADPQSSTCNVYVKVVEHVKSESAAQRPGLGESGRLSRNQTSKEGAHRDRRACGL